MKDLIRWFQCQAFDRYVLHLPRRLVQPKMRSVALDPNVEYEVVYVGYGVEIQQKLGVGKPPPYCCHRKSMGSSGSEPAIAVQTHRRDPFRVIKLQRDCGL